MTADVAQLQASLQRDGVAGMPASFPPAWADDLHADFLEAFQEARSHPGGTIGRGPQRYYFAVPPERIHGFLDLVIHPDLTALCAAVLGPDYRFVELAFDVPLPGAKTQPWHRDFAIPSETRDHRRLTSLAFNVTTVDVTPEMAPFEISPGTHWDDGEGFVAGMFPPTASAGRYDGLASRRHPQRGDMSVRTGLTVHRGTDNHSDRARAVLILGVVGAEVDPGEVHDLVMTRPYHDGLPESVREHLRGTVVDELKPLVQKHDIEGLLMGG